MSIILGFIGIAIGAVLVIKTGWFYSFFGPIEWAEQHLGSSGGTRLFYKLLGIGIIIVSALTMLGVVQSLLTGLFLFGQPNTGQ